MFSLVSQIANKQAVYTHPIKVSEFNMKRVLLMMLCAAVFVGANASDAFALPAFKKLFAEKYAPEGSNADFEEAVKKSGCYTCHVKGEEKSVNTPYGAALAKEVPGDAKDRIDAAKEDGTDDAEKDKINKEFEAAMIAVEKVKSASGKTYGEILKSHNLP